VSEEVSQYDFSVVIPTFERWDSLPRLLDSLSQLDYPRSRFEVIVVDDGGRIPLKPEIFEFQNRLNLSLLAQENRGPGAARNYGAAHARGRYLAFTDDDCVADPKWLLQLKRALAESDCAICGGGIVNALPGDVYAVATQMLSDYLHEYYNPVDTSGAFFTTNNMVVPRDAFMAMGGFDSALRFGEDREFCYRWTSKGGRFIYAPGAIVQHLHGLTIGSFLRLHFCYGTGTAWFRERSRQAGLKRVRLSSLGWYLNLVLSGVRRTKGLRGLWLALLLVATQAANATGAVWGFIGAPLNRSAEP
jgi:GT2 family glycosyltransferase